MTITVTSGELTPEFSVHRPDGGQLCSCSTPFDIVTLSCFPEVSGTYTIRIGDDREDNTGTYEAFLQVVSEPSSGTLPLGATVTGTVSPAPEKDVYSFAAAAVTEISVTITVTSGELTPEFSVHRPDGSQLCSSSTRFDIVTLSCFPEVSGTYTIRIGDDREDNTGTYEAFLQPLG